MLFIYSSSDILTEKIKDLYIETMDAHADKVERMMSTCRSLYDERQQNLYKCIVHQDQDVGDSWRQRRNKTIFDRLCKIETKIQSGEGKATTDKAEYWWTKQNTFLRELEFLDLHEKHCWRKHQRAWTMNRILGGAWTHYLSLKVRRYEMENQCCCRQESYTL
jgi:hypothetical protein